jgi:hypothetical protein
MVKYTSGWNQIHVVKNEIKRREAFFVFVWHNQKTEKQKMQLSAHLTG